MAKNKQAEASKKLSEVVVKGMQEKKASNIVVMDLREVKNAVADFFIICSGSSDKHLAAISQSVDDEVFKTLHEDPWSKEGKHNKEWMLLDYVTVVVHIFKKDKRQFYALEKLWGDAVIKEIKDIDEPPVERGVKEILEVKKLQKAKAPEIPLEIIVNKVVKEVKAELEQLAKLRASKTPKKLKAVKVTKIADASKKVKAVKKVKTKETKKPKAVIKSVKSAAPKKAKAVKKIKKAKRK